MRPFITVLCFLALAGLGCPAAGNPEIKQRPATAPASAPAEATPASQTSRRPEEIPAERRVWAYLEGQRRAMDIDEARSYGLTVFDLSDDWVPYIF